MKRTVANLVNDRCEAIGDFARTTGPSLIVWACDQAEVVQR